MLYPILRFLDLKDMVHLASSCPGVPGSNWVASWHPTTFGVRPDAAPQAKTLQGAHVTCTSSTGGNIALSR